MDDIWAWYKSIRRSDFRTEPAQFDRSTLCALSPTLRALAYAMLSNGRGRLSQALGFVRLAKELADTEDERTYALYLYGYFLSMGGDREAAIKAQHDCVNACYAIRNKELASDALLHLSSMYSDAGDQRLAKEYEREASLVLYAW